MARNASAKIVPAVSTINSGNLKSTTQASQYNLALQAGHERYSSIHISTDLVDIEGGSEVLIFKDVT